MQIALLGADEVTLSVAAAAVHQGKHQIVLAADLGSHAGEVRKRFPELRIDDDWERLLDTSAIDAVLVAADRPAIRVEQLRRLVQLGTAALVSHPLTLSMLDYYELDMIRGETQCPLLAYLPARWHPAVDELQSPFLVPDTSPIGPIEQIVLDRFATQRDRETVLRQFARDADVLQYLAGDATQLHALGSPGENGPYANLAVQWTCGHGAVCRWLAHPIEAQSGGRLTLVGSEGKAILWMPDDQKPWRLEMREGAGTKSEEFPNWNPAAIALEKMVALGTGASVSPSWAEAARTVELAETIDRSLARGRTIDLHQEEFTDIGTFKGTMTSLGCGLLVAGLILVVFVLMARALAAQAGWNRLVDVLDFWPYLLLGVLGIYLVLQMLVLVGKPSNLPKRHGEPDPHTVTDPHDLSP